MRSRCATVLARPARRTCGRRWCMTRKLFQELLDERAAQRIGSITMATPLRKDEPQQIDNQKLTTADLAKRQRAATEPKGPRPVLGEGMPAEQNLEQAGREPKQSAS